MGIVGERGMFSAPDLLQAYEVILAAMRCIATLLRGLVGDDRKVNGTPPPIPDLLGIDTVTRLAAYARGPAHWRSHHHDEQDTTSVPHAHSLNDDVCGQASRVILPPSSHVPSVCTV